MNWNHHFMLLQMNDSLFPIGAYAHSYGLETYIQKGIVRDAGTARLYLKNRLKYQTAFTELLAVRLAYEAAGRKDLERLEELEDILEASRIPRELREAAKKIGNRFIKTLLEMKAADAEGFFKLYVHKRKGRTASHPCAYGVFCSCCGIPLPDALAGFLYGQASAIVTNCVKTIPLSQLEGQRILYGLYGLFEEILEDVMMCPEELLGLSAPGFDLRSMEHEYLYSRLYMS